MKISRRKLIQSSLALGTLGSLAWLKPADLGRNHNSYFKQLSSALKENGFSRPSLIIDTARLLENIRTLKTQIADQYAYRIVVKSLPSLPLLYLIAAETGSRRFMLFDEQFILTLLKHRADSDILLGKPLPVSGTQKILNNLSQSAGSEIRWLVDSTERLNEYRQLARQRKQTLRINLELDIGLHRGGFKTEDSLAEALMMIKQDPLLQFDGFMGYEPHVVKVPGDAAAHLQASLAQYREMISIARQMLAEDFPNEPVFNTAGSPTYQLHTALAAGQSGSRNSSPCNELSAGSCLVKPMDFDIPTLTNHQAACFIATPVLKSLPETDIPGVPGLGKLITWWNPNRQTILFTYGGYWKAEPVSPPGLSVNPLYGRSSNQEMLNASRQAQLKMNDWVFLRPTQSESVFLQFGAIAVYDQGQLNES